MHKLYFFLSVVDLNTRYILSLQYFVDSNTSLNSFQFQVKSNTPYHKFFLGQNMTTMGKLSIATQMVVYLVSKDFLLAVFFSDHKNQ